MWERLENDSPLIYSAACQPHSLRLMEEMGVWRGDGGRLVQVQETRLERYLQ
jgi:hypothetical protein